MKHKISLTTAILMSLNIMIGSGILIGPGVMANVAGMASFLGWIIVAVLFVPLVYSTVQMARLSPGSGGFYQYAKAGLNAHAGFVSSLLYIAGYIFALSVQILALQKSIGSTLTPMLANGIIVSVLIALNLLGLRFFSTIMNALTIWKILPVVSLVALLPFIFNPSVSITSAEMSMLPYSLPMAMFGYFGFEYACSMSPYIENSRRNAPLAILIGFSLTAALYTLFTLSALYLMGPTNLAQQGASAYAEYVPFGYLKALLQCLIPLASTLTLFAAALGLLNVNGVMMHALAQKKLLYASELLSRQTAGQRPLVPIVISGFLAYCIVTLLPHLEIIGTIAILGVFLAFILPLVSLIILQAKNNRHVELIISAIALLTVVCLVGYSLLLLGSTNTERFLYSIPLLLFLIGGALMYTRKN